MEGPGERHFGGEVEKNLGIVSLEGGEEEDLGAGACKHFCYKGE